MILSLSLLLVALTIITHWWCKKLYKYYVDLGHYSGPFPLPLIGSAYKFPNATEVIKSFHYYQEKYGYNNFKLLIGNELRLIIIENKAAEELLTSTTILNKSYEYNFLRRWIGMGLITALPENWRVQRKLLTPAFHFKILEKFVNVYNTQSNVMVKKMEKYADGNYFDILPAIHLCTLDMICETAMGVSIKAQNNSESVYVNSAVEISTIVVRRNFSPLKFIDYIYKLTGLYRQEVKTLDALHKHSNSIIKQRKQQLAMGDEYVAKVEDDDIGQKPRIAFLDLLLQTKINGENFSEEYIQAEVDGVLFAAHQTLSAGTGFALYSLGQYPEIQRKVVEELQTIFEENKLRNPTYQDLQSMKYLEMVIKETMRLYPPVVIFGRKLQEDTMFGGKMLPKGLSISVFVNGLHKQPDIFPDPEKFDPERFSPENVLKRPPFAYLPFSAGSRNCIGFRYALLSMKATIASVLRNYEISTLEGHKPILASNFSLMSANGLPVRLKKRIF